MPSNVPGYLAPKSSPAPLEDAALEDFLQQVLAGLSGLADDLVRPMWQLEPPTQPQRGVNWLSFGITVYPCEGYPFEDHDPDSDGGIGDSEQQRHETVEVHLACFGDNAGATLRLVRDAIQIDQNLAVLRASGFGLQETTEIVNGPLLAKSRWQRRMDMKLVLRRQVSRKFELLNILEADIFLKVPLSSQDNP